MTLQQFNGLEEIMQAAILWKRGVHIATRDDQVYQYLLYQLDSFYVEVLYHVEFEVIHRFRTFSNTSQLEPYLEPLNITDLIL